MTLRELFEFITDVTITPDMEDEWLERKQKEIAERGPLTTQQEMDEAVFREAHIPRTLNDVADVERDLDRAKKGDLDGIFYQTVVGMSKDLSGPATAALSESAAAAANKSSGDDEEGDSDDDDEDDDDEGEESEEEVEEGEDEDGDKSRRDIRRLKSMPAELAGLSKADRKKKVKELKAEKRANKTPKHVKKRASKLAKQGIGSKRN